MKTNYIEVKTIAEDIAAESQLNVEIRVEKETDYETKILYTHYIVLQAKNESSFGGREEVILRRNGGIMHDNETFWEMSTSSTGRDLKASETFVELQKVALKILKTIS